MLFGYLPIKILFHWPGPSWTWISPLSSAWVDKNSSCSRMASILWAASAENKSPVDSYKTWRMHVPPMNLLSKSFAKHIAPTRTPKYLNKKAFPLFPRCQSFRNRLPPENSQHKSLPSMRGCAALSQTEPCLVANSQLQLWKKILDPILSCT